MTWNINNSTPSTSSQEQEAAFSLTSYLATIQSELVKLNSTQEMSSSPGSETVSFQTSQSGMTSAPSTESPGEEQLTFSLEDFPAKTSVRQELETEVSQELAENALAYGRNMQDSLEKCSLSSSLPKTLRFYALGDLQLSSKTLPKWGIMQDGVYWEPINSVQSTVANDFGCWLPTPTCSMKNGAARNRFFGSPTYRACYPQEWIRTSHHCDAYLNADYADGLIGFPHRWTDLKPLETHKFLEWQQAHSTFSHEA